MILMPSGKVKYIWVVSQLPRLDRSIWRVRGHAEKTHLSGHLDISRGKP